jgi:hypothetical protein
MVGVSGPLLAESSSEGSRFLVALTVAGLAGSATLAMVAVAVSLAVQAVLPFGARLAMLVVWAILLGVADLANRTPQLWRQVPQRLVRELKPGMLGMFWGFDLGLIVTTKKVTSLGWLAIGGMILVRPALVPVCVIAIGLTTSLSVALWSVRIRNDTQCLLKRRRDWMTRTRMLSGTGMLMVATLVVGVAVG